MFVEEKDEALRAVRVNFSPGREYAANNRKWQGIPGIAIADNGRLWATFYSGGDGEGPDNYAAVVSSGDGGVSWSEPLLVIDPPGKVRAYDPCLWIDPQGELWLFWAQCFGGEGIYDGRCGVWAIVKAKPDLLTGEWSAPRRLGNGVMMNKPTVLSTGEWLLPAAVWSKMTSAYNHLPDERHSNVWQTVDRARKLELLGYADVDDKSFDEHMIVERSDGSLWMLIRLLDGIGESFSADRGRTWTPGRRSALAGPGSRIFIRRLRSGRLLLVNHVDFDGRNNLTAMLSEDDGATWIGRLTLDERANVSYPDGMQAEDGRIFVVYDRERFREGEILLAAFTEDDILRGRCASEGSKLRMIVSHLR